MKTIFFMENRRKTRQLARNRRLQALLPPESILAGAITGIALRRLMIIFLVIIHRWCLLSVVWATPEDSDIFYNSNDSASSMAAFIGIEGSRIDASVISDVTGEDRACRQHRRKLIYFRPSRNQYRRAKYRLEIATSRADGDKYDFLHH